MSFLHGRQDARLVGILDRDEDGAGEGHAHAGAELALGEGHVVGLVEAHDLAGRAHLGAQENVDAGEAVEGKNRFLYSDMRELLRFQLEAGEGLARHHPGGDLGDRLADHLGDEGHGARGARIDLEHIDVVVLDGELHIHEADDA